MIAPILALAGVAAVQAGPLVKRQTASSIASEVSSAASSAVSSVASETSGAASSASSAVSSASSAAVPAPTDAANTTAPAPTGGNTTTGNESYPLYPCPTGFLLTYVSANQTVPVNVTQAVQAFGLWANSSYFPNITESEGGNDVGATHTINLQGVSIVEELVGAELNSTSGSGEWTWNMTNGPISAMGVSISNYSTVLSIYDPGFTTTGEVGGNTTLLTYTNFCANSQAEGISLVSALAQLELGTFAGTLGGAAAPGGGEPAPSGPASSAPAPESSAPAPSSEPAPESSSAAPSGPAGSVSSAVSSVASGATSGPAAATSSAGGAVGGATSAVGSAVSSVLPGAAPSSTA